MEKDKITIKTTPQMYQLIAEELTEKGGEKWAEGVADIALVRLDERQAKYFEVTEADKDEKTGKYNFIRVSYTEDFITEKGLHAWRDLTTETLRKISKDAGAKNTTEFLQAVKKYLELDEVMNCGNCKFCTFVKSAYGPGLVNECEKQLQLDWLSVTELENDIKAGCRFHEYGQPQTDFNRVSFDD